jgi:DNA-binding MarR family transcriptional regulator
MDRPTHLIEYETMLLSRYSLLVSSGALDRSAYILLSRVRAEGPMSIRQFSDAFGLDPSTLNRQTSAMTRAGLLERIPDPEGGIARKFRITETGERRLDEHRDAIIASLDAILADWTPDEVADFAAHLKRFNASIERRVGRPWPRPE